MARILTVDDSKSIRDVMVHILTAQNHEVIPAKDGLEALEYAKTNSFDLALVDVNMPHMNGISLVSALRKMDAYKFTPIVMVTTETDESQKKSARAAGATGWLAKPFSSERLLGAVNKLLGIP